MIRNAKKPELSINEGNTWDGVSFDDKRRVLDLLVTTVEATSDKMNIIWKI